MLKQIDDDVKTPKVAPFNGMPIFTTPNNAPTTDFLTMF